jgi:hypothetical protein
MQPAHTAARISGRFGRFWLSWRPRASPTGSDSLTAGDRRGTLERSVRCRSGGHSALQDHPTDAPGAAHGGRDVVDAEPRAVTIPSTPYSVLSVAADASEQIRDAFRKLMRRLHPDSRGTIPNDTGRAGAVRGRPACLGGDGSPRRGVLMTGGPRVRSATPDHRPAWLVAAARPVSGSSAFRDPGRWPQSDPRGRPLPFAVASRPSRFFLPDGSSTGPVKSRATGPAR